MAFNCKGLAGRRTPRDVSKPVQRDLLSHISAINFSKVRVLVDAIDIKTNPPMRLASAIIGAVLAFHDL